MPQYAAGMRIEPPMSLPMSSKDIPVATATAAPDELPPGVRARSQGLRVSPNRRLQPCGAPASSGRWLLPSTMAPAARRRATTVASRGGR